MQPQALAIRKARRRSRVPLSCDSCRTRKLKCNREKPCQNCTARGEQAACKFRESGNSTTTNPKPTARGDRSSSGGGSPTITQTGHNGDIMGQRIDHLEELVKKLIAERPPSWSPPQSLSNSSPQTETSTSVSTVSDQDSPTGATGKTVIDGIHSVYLGGDDWSVVLQEINELKRTWNQEQDDASGYSPRPTPSHTVDGSSLLFEQVKPLERMEIVSTLPPKHEIDRLIAIFFNRQAFPIAIPPILHEPTFMREYNDHWNDPSRTNFIWLGLVFSILGITMLAYHQYGEPPEYEGLSESLFQLYRMRTAQCLLSGDIAKCLPYTVETLRFNATAELNRKDDNRRGLWLMTGVVIRAAINMGYHRDPAELPGISVLQAEYRRRVWSSVVSMDDMASFLGGFPRTMSAIYSDTLEPRNLHESELLEEMTALPPSRPLTDATPATYLIVKGRLFRELGRVADFNSNPNLGSYGTVLDIDRAVRDVYESFPPHMRVPVPSESDQWPETPPIRTRQGLANFSNISLVGMYHRGVCTLHRKFLAESRLDDRFKLSRDRCISSALGLLAFQHGLVPAFYRISQTRQMLMLGHMCILLELALRRKSVHEIPDEPDSAVLLRALETSCDLLAGAMEGCDETKRVHKFLRGMLWSFRAGSGGEATDIPVFHEPEQRAELLESPPLDAFNGVSNFSFEKDWSEMDFDWATWDTFVEESNYDTGPTY